MTCKRLFGCAMLHALILIAVGWSAAVPARAEFPDKPIKLIVPFPAGGTVDIVARVVGARLSQDLGVPVVIENKGGAGGVIATDSTAKAAPDGYTLLLTTPNHTINAVLNAKLPYDTEKDLVPISIVGEIPMLFVAHASVPFNDFQGFVAHAKTNPGKLNYASAGNGTLPHVGTELMLRQLNITVAHIPYRGAAPAMTDLLAGQVQLKMDTYATAAQHMQAGKLRALGYASRARSPLMPNVPTIAELGLPGFESVLWMGLVAPAGTPKPVLAKLSAAAIAVARAPEVIERFRRDGVDPVGNTSEQFGALITREIGQWRELIKTVKLSAD